MLELIAACRKAPAATASATITGAPPRWAKPDESNDAARAGAGDACDQFLAEAHDTGLPADPFPSLTCRTSPVSPRLASSGW